MGKEDEGKVNYVGAGHLPCTPADPQSLYTPVMWEGTREMLQEPFCPRGLPLNWGAEW